MRETPGGCLRRRNTAALASLSTCRAVRSMTTVCPKRGPTWIAISSSSNASSLLSVPSTRRVVKVLARSSVCVIRITIVRVGRKIAVLFPLPALNTRLLRSATSRQERGNSTEIAEKRVIPHAIVLRYFLYRESDGGVLGCTGMDHPSLDGSFRTGKILITNSEYSPASYSLLPLRQPASSPAMLLRGSLHLARLNFMRQGRPGERGMLSLVAYYLVHRKRGWCLVMEATVHKPLIL